MRAHTEQSLNTAPRTKVAGLKLDVRLASGKHPEWLSDRKREKPHEALVKLTANIAALQQFTNNWGELLAPGKASALNVVIQEGPSLFHDAGEAAGTVDTVLSPKLMLQKQLRSAWDPASSRHKADIDEIQNCATKYTRLSWDSENGQFLVVGDDLWSTICVLFLRDRAAGRTALCENPDCLDRYFLKKRRTDRVCGAPECFKYRCNKDSLNGYYTRDKGRRRDARQKAKRRKRRA